MGAFDDRSTVATWLDEAGYTNGFFGKYLDAYQRDALSGYVPPGWERWVAFYHSQFQDYRLNVDGQTRSFGSSPWDYSTLSSGRGPRPSSGSWRSPCSWSTRRGADGRDLLDRYRNEFKDLPPHRPPSFGVPGEGSPAWLHEVEPMSVVRGRSPARPVPVAALGR